MLAHLDYLDEVIEALSAHLDEGKQPLTDRSMEHACAESGVASAAILNY